MIPQDSKSKRLKRAELLGGIGAVVLGVGIGLFFSSFLNSFAAAFLLVGIVAHAAGMFQKHRLEKETTPLSIWWSELLYWVCWAALLILFGYIAVDYFWK
jgi:ABC-type Mn2+/Zn2+ transport system permease subunit